MKKISALICFLLALLAAFSASAEGTSNVTYRGGAEHFIVLPEDEDLFQNFKMMMPGETRGQTILVKNEYSKPLYFYLRAEKAENEEVNGVRLIDVLGFNLVNGTETVYDGTLVGSEQGMSRDILLGYLAPGDTATLKATLSAPGSLDNRYMTLNAAIDWVFTVKDNDEKVEPKKTVDVGDGTRVKAGDSLTYTIEYKNYRNVSAEMVIKDKLDPNVTFVSADNGGKYTAKDHTVTWTLNSVDALAGGSVHLTVTVNDSAKRGSVSNSAGVKVGNDAEIMTGVVKNPVDDDPAAPEKTVNVPEGKAVLAGSSLTYTVSYTNHESMPAKVVIKDKLDANVTFVSAGNNGVYDPREHAVTWTLNDVGAFAEGKVTVTVKVNVDAGETTVVNSADVIVGNEAAVTTNAVETPVRPAVGFLELKKVWDDEYDRDGIRPGSVSVRVSNKYGTVGTYELNAKNNWYVTVNDLPRYDKDGSVLMYKVEEINVPSGYTALYTSNGTLVSITNRHNHVSGTHSTPNGDDVALSFDLNMHEGDCFD